MHLPNARARRHPRRRSLWRRRVAALSILVASGLIAPVDRAEAANRAHEKEALALIYEAADRICGSVERSGSSRQFALTGSAKAELSKVLKKLADIGIEGRADYRTSEYEGVLQRDLAKLINVMTECKQAVFLRLAEVMLVPTTHPSGASTGARASRAVRNPRQYHWQCDIRLFDDGSGDDIASGRLNFGPITSGIDISYAKARFDLLETDRLRRNITFDTAIWGFMGECRTTCLSFLDKSGTYQPVLVVQDVVLDEARGEMDLRGAAMAREAGKHGFFAYLSGTCRLR